MQKVDLPLFGETLTFTLSNFEGPLELLLYLIQKEEIDLFDIPLKELTTQFFKELEALTTVDIGADFLWNSSRLLLLKSRTLLPKGEPEGENESDFRIEILQKLVEYARLKEIAKTLVAREEKEQVHFPRLCPPPPKVRGTGLEEVTIEELVGLLQELLKKCAQTKEKVVTGEVWEIGPKISWFEEQIASGKEIPFSELFSEDRPKGEWIVFFLALLELMKLQKVCVRRGENEWWIANVKPI